MTRIQLLSTMGLALLLPLLSMTASAAKTQYSALHDYRLTTEVSGLERPWGMEFLPDGSMLVTEKAGTLRKIENGQLLDTPLSGIPPVFSEGQAGLLDIALHPSFDQNRLVYLAYSRPLADDQSTTAVIRGELDGLSLNNVTTVFEAQSRGRGHYGSRLIFDRDGYLFITIGDRQVRPKGKLAKHPSQNLADHHGTIVRLHDDGRVPEDNPFVGKKGALPEIWSYGHRNPQGMTYDARHDRVWATEHGPQGGDELNLIEPGLNYGWPVIGYGANYGEGNTIHASTHRDGMQQPQHFWVPSIGVAGVALYQGSRFPHWNGAFLAGGLRSEEIALLHMDDTRVIREETLPIKMGRIRDVVIGPDELVYLAIDGEDKQGAILRMEPIARGEVAAQQ